MKGTEHMQVKMIEISDNNLFTFSPPKFKFGQRVQTKDGLVGYIVGLDFYPEAVTWSYGVYILSRTQELIEEVWYEAEQLEALD